MTKPKPSKSSPAKWRNRIVGAEDVDPKVLAAHPLNARLHSDFQQRAMTGAFEEIGWLQAVLVNRISGKILDGHMRVALACRDKQQTVPVSYVELTQPEEAAALASIDSIGSLADIDFGNLGSLLDIATISDSGLGDFFSDLREQVGHFTLTDEGASDNSGGGDRDVLGKRPTQIKAVLFTDQAHVFERALAATGKKNRAEAIIEVCEGYLKHAGQFNI